MHRRESLSRRGLLQAAGTAFAAGFPFRALAADHQIGPLITTLSSYMAEAARRPLPEAVIEKTKQIILDTLTAMISGSELPPGKFVLNFARLYQGAGGSTVVASKT